MVRGERVLASSEHGAGRGVLVGVGAVIGGGVALRSGFLVVFVEVEVVGLVCCGLLILKTVLVWLQGWLLGGACSASSSWLSGVVELFCLAAVGVRGGSCWIFLSRDTN